MNERVPIDERHQVNKIAVVVAARRGFRSGLVANHVGLLMNL